MRTKNQESLRLKDKNESNEPRLHYIGEYPSVWCLLEAIANQMKFHFDDKMSASLLADLMLDGSTICSWKDTRTNCEGYLFVGNTSTLMGFDLDTMYGLGRYVGNPMLLKIEMFFDSDGDNELETYKLSEVF